MLTKVVGEKELETLMEYASPNRYRVVIKEQNIVSSEQIEIGEKAFVRKGNSDAWLELPIGLAQIGVEIAREPINEFNEQSLDNVKFIEEIQEDGNTLLVYEYVFLTNVDSKVKLWVSKSTGLPFQVEAKGIANEGKIKGKQIHITWIFNFGKKIVINKPKAL